MISPLGLSKLLKDEEKPHKIDPVSSNVSLSEIYAQEIADNHINENKEAILRKNALESGTYENTIKNKLNTETANLILSETKNPLVLRPKAIPKNAFSYIQNSDFVSKPKPPLFPKPKDRPRIKVFKKSENDNIKQAQDMQSDIKIGAIPANKDMSCLTFDSSSDKQTTGDHNSSKNEMFRSEDSRYSKLEEPPPLPTRPPPVFKYPLGTFYKETEDLNEARKKKERRKPRESLQNECHLSDRFMNDEITEINDRSSNLEALMIREIIPIGTPSEIRNDEPVKTLPMLELKINKDRSFPPVIKSPVVQKTSSNGAERLQKMLPSEDLRFNVQARKKSLPADFQKSTISVPLGTQEKKPPQPAPRPELNVIKDNKKYSENVSGIFPKRLISTPLEESKSRKSLSVSDIEIKKNIGLNQKSKSIDSEIMGLEKMKPKVPCKPNNLFHQRLDKILIEQRIREQECINPMSTLKPSIENLAENDWMDSRKSTTPEIISTTTKRSLDRSIGFKTDGESFLSKSANSLSGKLENIRMDSSSQDLRDEQGEIDFSQDPVADFSVFHSLNRPTLPQKMKSTQRSLSYTSLVQTVKDIGATIWNPHDKSKRSSTGMIPKTTDEDRNETEHSGQTDPKFLEVKRFPEEEKVEIWRSTWFHDISATEAQQRLLKLDQDGAFLIRPTSRPTDNIQYTASITYGRRVFNIHIRRKENYHFALGKEKEGEKSFQKLSDLIKYYQDVPFDIHPTGSSDPHAICFRVTPPH